MDGTEIKRKREAIGLTQSQLAALTGIPASRISDYERKIKPLAPEAAAIIADVFGMFAKVGAREDATKGELAQVLGEAVLMLTPDQRNVLYERSSRSLVNTAAANAAMAHIQGTLAEALMKEKHAHRIAQDELERIRTAMS